MHPDKTVKFRVSTLPTILLLAITPLFSACHNQDGVDTTAKWWHDMQGGEIDKLRPPPPGADAPYPHIGRTPTSSPEFPSREARADLTLQLEAQRNVAQRESAANGTLAFTPKPIPAPPKATPASDNQNSLTMTTVGQPNPPPTPASSTASTLTPAAPPPPPKVVKKDIQPAPEAELPKVVQTSIPPTPPGEFPKIGAAPPPAPRFAGFNIPRDAIVRESIHPDFDTSTPDGVLIRFQPTTDHLVGNEDKEFQRIISQRGNQQITIVGFGATMSADAGLSIADQTREITLGLLRAKTVAAALMQRGVPASAILLRAEAIGDGVRVQNGG
ncbi:OmpA family protein [Swingsia samuiensis]|uniref:OmpA-like domain-containing protein n=1 Tax=Swingsia samuiensis TaxID=1293412 RepID=A0A4Y6UIX7_9PROT|nr:OmpA family protein [Swingsia samuiensis]QDH16578.1 hypothetical protein E3D00_02570 [Swingsia samuiensis]